MVKINDTTTFPLTAPASGDFVIGTDISDTGNSADGEVVNFTLQSIADLAKPILSPDLQLTYKTGSATRTSTGTSTVVTLDTTDLSNLADMTLALVTGHIVVSSSSNATVEVNCNRASPTLLEKVSIGTVTANTSFSRIITLSSDTSISLSFDFNEAGTSSATVYGEILILGR